MKEREVATPATDVKVATTDSIAKNAARTDLGVAAFTGIPLETRIVDQWKEVVKDGKRFSDPKATCPDYINEALRKMVIARDGKTEEKDSKKFWKLSPENCPNKKAGEADFNKDPVYGELPFGMIIENKERCFQRLKWCSGDFKVYYKDSEYKTWKEEVGAGIRTGMPKDEKDDNSLRCPTFINSKLAKSDVKPEWYPVDTLCTRDEKEYTGTGGGKFKSNGFQEILPFSQGAKCY